MSSHVSFLRHAGWFSPEDAKDPLNIVGVGATGSNIALMAAKMGFHRFNVWDADVVEPHNLPNQAYDVQHVGSAKVEALKDVLTRFNPEVEVNTFGEFFKGEDAQDLVGPLVLTVDTMSARKDIGEGVRLNPLVPMMLETRLGFSHAEIHIVDPSDLDEIDCWIENLRSDDEVKPGPCNLTICATLVNLVAAYSAHALCGYYASHRSREEWSSPRRTIINMENKLEVWNL